MLPQTGGMKNPSLELTHREVSRERLVALVREIPGARIGLKIAALLLSVEGQRPGWICEVLGVSRQSLNVWIHQVNEQGLSAVKPKSRPGRPARLTSQIRKQLEVDLERSPQDVGLNRSQWDGPTLARYLKQQFGMKLTVRQAQRWMHQLGYRLKRAGYSYLQANSQEAQKFQRMLKKTPQPGTS
jgi:transposase